jgi:hypothetical protein
MKQNLAKSWTILALLYLVLTFMLLALLYLFL